MEKYNYEHDEKPSVKESAEKGRCPKCGNELDGRPPVCPKCGSEPFEKRQPA